MAQRDGIGIFDSGVGGLTVARAVLQALPGARIVYFGDNGYAPYGDRPVEQIGYFVQAILRFLETENVAAIVAGCNISWALLVAGKIQRPRVPVVELLSAGAAAAAKATRTGVVGVLATTRTVESGAYPRAIQAGRPEIKVVQKACPALVPLVERAELDSARASLEVKQCVQPLLEAGADAIVLGCTHYPFLAHLVAEHAGPDVRLVDPAEGAASSLQGSEALPPSGLEALDGRAHRFYTSGSADLLRRYVAEYLRLESPNIAQLDLHPGVG